MSGKVFNAGGRSYTITNRSGIVRSVERRGEKLVVNCAGSTRSIEMQNARVTAEDGNEWQISTGASFSVQPGTKVSVIFAAVDGGAPHAGLVRNADTGAIWWWSMNPLLPNFRWFFGALATLPVVWVAIWSFAGEPSTRFAFVAVLLSAVPVVIGMALRFLRRRRLTSVLRVEMEGMT
jgi:hypothetical protein